MTPLPPALPGLPEEELRAIRTRACAALGTVGGDFAWMASNDRVRLLGEIDRLTDELKDAKRIPLAPPSTLPFEDRYRLLASAVNEMPDTCDAACDSYGHSKACGDKESAWPAETIVAQAAELDRLRALLGAAPETKKICTCEGDPMMVDLSEFCPMHAPTKEASR